MQDTVLSPIIQYGFAGFCAVLIAIIVWLIRRLLCVLEETNKIIARNTEAIADLNHSTADLLSLNRQVHDKLISHPCIARLET